MENKMYSWKHWFIIYTCRADMKYIYIILNICHSLHTHIYIYSSRIHLYVSWGVYSIPISWHFWFLIVGGVFFVCNTFWTREVCHKKDNLPQKSLLTYDWLCNSHYFGVESRRYCIKPVKVRAAQAKVNNRYCASSNASNRLGYYFRSYVYYF